MPVSSDMSEHDSRNDPSTAASGSDRSVDVVLDALLVALRSDQDGARTAALKRALDQPSESGSGDEVIERVETLESAVAKLLRERETESETDDADDGPTLEAVRSDLDSTVEELAALRETVDGLESTETAFAARMGEIEARIDDLESRLDDEARTADLEAQIRTDARDGTLEDRLDDLETAVSEVSNRLATVESAAAGDRSDRSAARAPLEGEDGAGADGDGPTDRVAAPVGKRLRHVEAKLDARTAALASRIRDLERTAERIDALEDRLDERAAALETEIEDVNDGVEDAISQLYERTRSELSAVEADLAELDELRSSIDSLAADVDALEAHAADMTVWRTSVEESSAERAADGNDGSR